MTHPLFVLQGTFYSVYQEEDEMLKVCSLVEHQSGDDTCNKMVNDIYKLIQFWRRIL